MNQNRNTLFQNEYAIPSMQKAGSGISIFNLQQSEKDILEQGSVERRNTFSAFVNSRQQYLSRLSNLGNNWISGSSKQPTEKSIALSKDVLNDIGNWYAFSGYEKFLYPKVIMSPTPAGGIAMEIELFPSIRAYLSILNDNVSYEVENDGTYVEYEANKNNIGEQLVKLYNSNEGRYYSGWGVSL